MDQSSDVNSDHYYMEFVESSMSPAKDSSPYDDMEIEGSLTPKKPLMSPNDSDKPFKRHKPESNKGRPKQSFVWNYFITEDDSNYCQVTVPVSLKYPEGKCNHKLKSGTTTTNMINHLSKIHGIKNYTEEERLKAQGQKVINIQFPTLNEDQKFYVKKKYLKFLIDCGHQLELSKCEYFKEFVTTLNPLFEVPNDESLSYLAVNLYDIAIDALKKIFQKTDKICLTCNFWKSKGHGIIVITANWISDDYKHQEAFLTLEEIDFPYTPISIKKKIREIIHEWNISNKVSFITTENSARMIEAIKLLGGELNVERISCVSHTLQLVIGKALNVNQNIQIFILRVKRLVHFFSTPKQLESLIEAQEALHYTMVYEMVSEIPTRWNSSYHSWEKLLILRRDLTYLCNETNSGRDLEERDALKRIMLSVDEWDLMDHLVKILGKFEEITRLLDGSNYITMSLVYPMILTLKSHIKEMLAKYQNGQSSRDPYMNADSFFDDVITDIQNEILSGFQEISTNVEADVVCIEGKGSKQVLNISEPIKVDGLVISVLETLDIALNKYWSVSSDVGLFATILDPRTKKLKKFTEAERQRAIALLIDRYEIYNANDNDENKSESQNDADLLNNKSIMNMIMEDEESSDEEEENEINIYLKNKANRDILPLTWWENNEKKFTFLSKMAKEYLAIPVTSTDSTESSFGIINNTNNCMPPKKFYFLQKNSNLLKIYD